MSTRKLMIGAMSGTSADGVDAALVEITGRGLEMQAKYLGHVEQPYDAELRKRIFGLRESGQTSLRDLAHLGRDITLAYAQAVEALLAQQSTEASQVAAIAAHGQTLFHEVPETIQWLDPSLLAARTGIAVVSDFRRADLAAGGQGAPLVPFADWILFRHPEKTRVILNIGGIANLTYLPAGGGIDEVIAFDTGPGNCVLDHLMRQAAVEDEQDVDGRYSATGSVIPSIEKLVLSSSQSEWRGWERFAFAPPPKSTDTAQMMQIWKDVLEEVRPFRPSGGYSRPDLLRTAIFLTVQGVVVALRQHCPLEEGQSGEIIVGGGGARNATLMADLAQATASQGRSTGWHHLSPPPESARVWVKDWRMQSMDDLGFPSQARESVAFAIMGAATLDNEPSNVPSATGASDRVILGSITPRP